MSSINPAKKKGAVIHLRDLAKIYEMGATQVQALGGISLDIQDNEYVAIMGPSGSGKSTLAQVIAGHADYDVSAGTIEFNDKTPVTNIPMGIIYAVIPFCFALMAFRILGYNMKQVFNKSPKNDDNDGSSMDAFGD